MQAQNSQDQRNYGLDVFRILCCVGVLGYHALDDAFLCGSKAASYLYFLCSYCVNGFFLLSGFLLSAKPSVEPEYIEKKVTGTLCRLFYWIIFWAAVFFLDTGKLHSVWEEFLSGAKSDGILPVAWFVFTYCFLMLTGYPLWHLQKKKTALFGTLTGLWMLLLAADKFLLKDNTIDGILRFSVPQSLWFHIYLGYFCVGMLLYPFYESTRQHARRKLLPAAAAIHIASGFAVLQFSDSGCNPDAFYGTLPYTLWLTSLFWIVLHLPVRGLTCKAVILKLSKNTWVYYMGHYPVLVAMTSVLPIRNAAMSVSYAAAILLVLSAVPYIFPKMPLLRKLL